MADIKVSDKQPIDFKYNLNWYPFFGNGYDQVVHFAWVAQCRTGKKDALRDFGFLKKYKASCVFLILLVFALSTLDLAFNYTFKLIVDKATLFTQGEIALGALDQFLILAFAALLAVPAARGLGRWLYLGSINRLESLLIADIKRYFFDHLLSLSHGFHSSHKTGSLISRLARGSGSVETMTDVVICSFVPPVGL